MFIEDQTPSSLTYHHTVISTEERRNRNRQQQTISIAQRVGEK